MATDATGTPTSPDSIPTYATSADAPSGKGFNAAMAVIQTALSARWLKSLFTTTGDIAYASSASTPARLGIGSTGNVLTVAGGLPTWAPPSSTIGQEMARTTITTGVNITATVQASANNIMAVTFTADGTSVYSIEAYTCELARGTTYCIVDLWDNGGPTDLGRIVECNGTAAISVFGKVFLTPSAGAHTYSIRGWVDGATGVYAAGTGGGVNPYSPAWLRVVKVT